MLKLVRTIKKSLITGFALALFIMPAPLTFAEDPATCMPPPSTQSGVQWPTGSDAGTFTYQCAGDYAGKWTNPYYVYDPATGSRTPLYDPNYTYDCTADQWYKTQWDYAPGQSSFVKSTVATTAPSGVAPNCPIVSPVSDPASAAVAGNTGGASNLNALNSVGGSGSALTGTNNTSINNTTGSSMNNGIISFAGSGNALVTGNTTGGDATSGNAQAVANVINMLQSSSNVLGDPNMITFTANINGDVNGDLLLDPAHLSSVQPANSSTSLDNNVTVNNSTDASINNNISLGANSGNATVANNTSGGNATTGTADAVANVVNVLNSAVTAGKSFMGVININGNLNGDILLPPNFVDSLLASNVPRYSVNTAELNSDLTVNNTANQRIDNHVSAGAASGDAKVTNNTTGGNATTGLAKTNLTVFNLTGSDVVASNDLLVFVNVLGTWYGMIMNAPAGTTAAEIAGGVTSNTVNNTATLNNTANQRINNNIDVNARSGNAAVTGNTTGGDAASGKATASVNLVNMINNKLSLNGWFGLLFINVFGTWNGSFGVNTSAGDPVAASAGGDDKSSGVGGPMFRFVPFSAVAGGSNKSHNAPVQATGSGSNTSSATGSGTVLAAKTTKNAPNSSDSGSFDAPKESAFNRFALPIIGSSLAFAILLLGERKRFSHHT